MFLVVFAVLCLQVEPVNGQQSSAVAVSLIEITGNFEEAMLNVEQEYSQRRTTLFSTLIQDLETIQTDLTRAMKFDSALSVRKIGEQLRGLKTAEEQRDAVTGFLPEAPEAVTAIMSKVIGDDAEIQSELKLKVAEQARRCLDQLQQLLEAKSAEGDLDGCLEIRGRMEQLRTKYQPDSHLQAEFPATEDGLGNLKDQMVEASRQRIAERLDQLGTHLAGLKLQTISQRRMLAQMLQKLTKERSQEEKVKLLRGMVDGTTEVQRSIRSALTDIDEEIMSNARQLIELERRLKTLQSVQLAAAIEEWRVDDAVACYRKLQQAAPNDFRWQCQPEIASELPSLDPECARIMDRFEAARQIEELRFTERLEPGVAELKRRLGSAKAKLATQARLSREAIEHCIKWLDSGAADTLEDFRLIPTSLELPDAVQAGAFAEAADILLDERHKFRQAGIAGLKHQLQPEVSRLAVAGDLSACVAVFVHMRWLQRRFDPQPAQLARVPWETATVTANVLDVAGRLVRIRHTTANLSLWHSRRLVRIEGEPALPLEASTGNDGWKTADRFLPGPPSSGLTDIELGAKAFWLRGNLWELVTITERNGSDVTVKSTVDGKTRADRIDGRGLYRLAW